MSQHTKYGVDTPEQLRRIVARKFTDILFQSADGCMTHKRTAWLDISAQEIHTVMHLAQLHLTVMELQVKAVVKKLIDLRHQ